MLRQSGLVTLPGLFDPHTLGFRPSLIAGSERGRARYGISGWVDRE